MASALVETPPVEPSLARTYNGGYLKTSHGINHDYENTQVGGATDILAKQASSKEKFGDWRDDFFSEGFTVVKGAISREKAIQYRERAMEWFQKFPFGFDIHDKRTWTEDHLPIMMNGGMVMGYCATHEKWVWEARTEPGVIEPFAKLWGTDELLVSFDAVNITLPGRTDGIINLSEAGPLDGGLQLLQGSSELFELFFKENPPKPKAKDAPGQLDWYGFTLEDVEWFKDHGCKLIKINAEPGDVIIWDSRTVHYASLPQSETIRTIIYATYTPASLATPEDVALKADIFHRFEGTTHWPHCNIFAQGKAMRGDKICPGERNEPLEKPEMTDQVLKLAGVKPY
ncbi:hypothetical protein N7462_006629 [Penicillium macrosclerotiorum]|uniref:uncharacterized protein n=1 Tax=Penicillium macrosclerotiorum TaxID=303699 RepID=UPI0025498A30|nr:uncharacterized protein N7462_006629 [Penicillium macrosclerotiorum]KAJ5683464.1 hypothetical protein N7462_006629 [Penicillium macrosclerotiorum]